MCEDPTHNFLPLSFTQLSKCVIFGTFQTISRFKVSLFVPDSEYGVQTGINAIPVLNDIHLTTSNMGQSNKRMTKKKN